MNPIKEIVKHIEAARQEIAACVDKCEERERQEERRKHLERFNRLSVASIYADHAKGYTLD